MKVESMNESKHSGGRPRRPVDLTDIGKPPLPPAPERTSDPPAGADGQAGGQAESPTANRHPRWGSLEHDVKNFTALLRHRYADQIAADPRAFKKRVRGLLGRNLPPFAGHPQEDSINRAAELRKQGREWKEIYPLAIPDHAQLDAALRRQTESNLRAALRSRRNARRRRRREERYLVTADPQPSRPASAPTGPSAAGASGAGG